MNFETKLIQRNRKSVKHFFLLILFLFNKISFFLNTSESRHASLKALTRSFSGVVLPSEYDRSRHASLKALTRSFSGVVLIPEYVESRHANA